jgi:peptidoglycan/xylan/chitin deacetylase (PgdA/CDA1 family)
MPTPLSSVKTWVQGFEKQVMARVGTITAVTGARPLVALTFDDGPDPAYTPRLLEVLAAHGARATFFVVGAHASQHPELVARAARAGHAIANHTWDHPGLPLVSLGEQRRQINACAAAIAPHGVRLFRPPYGAQKRLTYWNIRTLGYEVVTWSLMIGDWEYKTSDELARTLIGGLKPGAIVLLHDRLIGAADPRAVDRGPIIEAVDRLLAHYAGKLSFVTVPELLQAGSPVRAKWVKREVP